VFRLIPGLERAEFARLGGLHRNTYLDAPRLLDTTLRLKAEPRLRFAGQITGCEGYVESAAIGYLAGRFASAEQSGARFTPPPDTTALGALLAHVTGGHLSGEDDGPRSYQPMNINFGLFPPLNMRFRGRDKAREKKQAITARAKADLANWLGTATTPDVAA
jgi:methylenetetrahydrofolate--tRNA-(uracil-5-)-methyltransferase